MVKQAKKSNMKIDLNKIKKIHFTGIKGVGMTALALCAKDLGVRITGSDIEEHFVTDETLAKAKIVWQPGFKAENIGLPDLVIFTAAHGGQANVEVLAAQSKNIPTMSFL
jgi:UDP-N-acetylmuramate--alanine ligase